MPSHYQIFRGARALTFSSRLGCGSEVPLWYLCNPGSPHWLLWVQFAPWHLEFEHRNLTVFHISSLGSKVSPFQRPLAGHISGIYWYTLICNRMKVFQDFPYCIEKKIKVCPWNMAKDVQRKKLCECQMMSMCD